MGPYPRQQQHQKLVLVEPGDAGAIGDEVERVAASASATANPTREGAREMAWSPGEATAAARSCAGAGGILLS